MPLLEDSRSYWSLGMSPDKARSSTDASHRYLPRQEEGRSGVKKDSGDHVQEKPYFLKEKLKAPLH